MIKEPPKEPESLFPLSVTSHFAPGSKAEIVSAPDDLLAAMLRALTRSPIGVATVSNPATPRPVAPGPDTA